MNLPLIIGLLQNASILLAFAVLYDFFNLKKDNSKHLLSQLGIGFILGIFGVILIATPWILVPGITFDTRSVLLSVTGLFFGPLPTLVAVILTGAYRIYLGGNGIFMGLAVILVSAGVGLLWRLFRPNWGNKNYRIELISMGFTVHVLMILCSFLLPAEIIFKTIKTIAFPVIIIYPLVTMFLGTVIQYRLNSRKIKQDLHSSQERWKFAIEGSEQGIWDWNPQTNEVYFSKQWKEMLGYSEEEVGNSIDEWDKRVHPDDKEKVYSDLNNHFAGKTPFYINEHRVLCKDGSYKWILDRGKVMEWTKERKPHRVIGTHTDISERKETQEKILSDEKLLRLFVEHSPASIAMFDLQMNYIVASKRYNTDYEIGDRNLIGHSHYEIFPEIPERWKEIHKRCLAGETIKEAEDPFPRANGKLDWIRWEIRPWFETENKIGGIILFSEVITEQKIIKEKIRESEEYNRMLFDQSPIGLAVAKMDGTLVDVNKAYADIIGRSMEETLQLSYLDITPEKYKEQEQKQLKLLKTKGKYGPYEKEYIHKNGHFVPVRLKGNIIERKGEKLIWSSIEDITDIKRTEEALILEKEFSEKIIETSTAIIVGLDKNHIIQIFNKGAENITGYSKAEVIGKDWFNLFLSAEIFDNMNRIWKDAWGAAAHSYENSILIKSGEERIISWQSAGIYDREYSSKDLLISIGEDITKRKKAEIMLQDEKEQKRVILELAGNPIFLKDNEHRIIFANRAFYDLFDLDENSVIGKTLAENVPENEMKHFLKIDRNVLDTGIPDFREEELTVGHIAHTIITSKTRFINESGNRFLVGSIHDITERKKAEEEIKQKNKSLAFMLEVSNSIASSNNIEQVLQLIINNATKMVGLDTGAIYTVKGEELFLAATTPPLSDDFPEVFRHSVVHYHPHIFKCISEKSSFILPDLETADLSPAEQTIKESRNMRTLLYVPLLIEDIAVGVLIVGTQKETRTFSKHEIDLYRTMSAQAAIIIKNFELYGEVQQNILELEQRVIERTKKIETTNNELETKIAEIERINRLFVGRELRMKELKEKMKVLVEKLEEKNK